MSQLLRLCWVFAASSFGWCVWCWCWRTLKPQCDGNRSVPVAASLFGWCLCGYGVGYGLQAGLMPDSPTPLGRKGHDRCCLARNLLLHYISVVCALCCVGHIRVGVSVLDHS